MQNTRFKRLGTLYILALLGIAASIITSQGLVQRYIGSQEDDSRVINVAGRQRMLSQKISKLVLKIRDNRNTKLISELDSAVSLLVRSHEGLLRGNEEMGLQGENSEKVREMYQQIDPYYHTIVGNSRTLISLIRSQNNDFTSTDLTPRITNILNVEQLFLNNMDKIVFQYDEEAKAKVSLLKRTELILFMISIAIIFLEVLFIFRPTARNVSATIEKLTQSEQSSNQMAKEMSKLYDELVRSYQDLESVDINPGSTKILANITTDGTFLNGSSELQELLSIHRTPTVTELLKKNNYSEDFINGLLTTIKNRKNWNGELKFTDEYGDFIWLEIFMIPLSDRNEVKIIGRDITEVKEAKMISREINSEKIARKVKEQQYRSVLILEGQEEERKRLSRELHDGVGQMLSALKMSLESVHIPREPAHNRKRFRDTKDLLKSVIQEIRRISFNLIPTNLADFGIVPALKRFCQEMSKLSNITVTFDNRTNYINRLESHVESNLYRIIQEGVNNAIKYSKAKSIHVVIEHTFSLLKITVEDNGRGFHLNRLSETGHFKSSGHGIFNMRERAAFINGEIEIETSPGQGTKISVSLPLE